jgi:hypothetical protein
MERIPKGAYTPEFRAQALRLIEEGAAMTEVSRQLSVPLERDLLKKCAAYFVKESR